MKKMGIAFVCSLILLCAPEVFAQDLSKEHQEIVSDSEEAKAAFIKKDADIQQLFKNSIGYVIFPNVGKGAYVVGGAAGNGAVYENQELVGMANLRQLDVGLQLGGQAFRQVIFFEDQASMDRFKEGKFSLSGNASAVALDKGSSRSIKFRDGLGIATMPKGGAMLEISVGGQKFSFEPISN